MKKKMTREKALKILIREAEKGKRHLAFDANAAIQYPTSANDFQRRQMKKYREITEAIEVMSEQE